MLVRSLSFGLAYALAILAGRAAVDPATGLAFFWPAAGVGALWALVVRSQRELIVVGATIGTIATVGNAATGFDPLPALVLGAANAVVALGTRRAFSGIRVLTSQRHSRRGAWGAERYSGLSDFWRLMAAGVVATTASAVVGMAGVALAGLDAGVDTALGWVMRNGSAVAVIAGPGLTFRHVREQVTRRDVAEAVVVVLVSLPVVWFVFGTTRALPLAFVPVALVVWSGLRLPVPLAAAHGASIALATFLLVRFGDGGPFGAIGDPTQRAYTIQAFMILSTGLAVVMATVATERERLVDSLAHSRRQMRARAEDLAAITRTVPDALVVVDARGRFRPLNEAAHRWVGAPLPSGFAPSPPPSLAGGTDPDTGDLLEGVHLRALRGERVDDELVLLDDRTTGEARMVSLDAAPLYDEQTDEPDRALLVLHDSTEEQQRVAAVHQARERSERLVADAPHGIAVLDREGRMVRANASLAEITGRPTDDLVGMPFDALSPGHPEEVARHLERVVEQHGDLVAGEWTITRPTGEDVRVALTSRVLTAPEEADELVVVNVIDVSERHRYEQRLAHLADHDALTGLPNRRRFEQELARHHDRCEEHGPVGALILLDLDNFKDVNDTLGHAAGDQLIASTAAVLRGTLRASDVVARLGGDEFAVLLPHADRAGAEGVASHVVDRIRAHTSTLDGVNRRVTASVGVVTFAAAARHDADALALADMLMYDAKDDGRNRYVVLDDDANLQPRSGARLAWRSRIENALENDLFALHLQPVVDVRTNRVSGAEALLRLVDEDEPVPPGRFVYIAERTGLAPAMDAWVVRHGIDLLRRLQDIDPSLTLSLNLSGQSMGDPMIEEELVSGLRRHGLDAQSLVIEVTETAAVSDVRAAQAFAARLGALGARFALDDFGTGFGSFSYLKHMRFDVVKIDGEFVSDADRSDTDRAILESIVQIAHHLGKRTVAEFVGRWGTLDVVRDLGIDFAQGYLLGEPVPFEVFVETHLSKEGRQRMPQPPAEPRLVPSTSRAAGRPQADRKDDW